MSQSQFLQTALKASQAAEEVILKYYQQELNPKIKPDNSPVTKADQEAEEIIIQTIKKDFPEHGFLGEESGGDINHEYTWIIDPIDGTRNFVRKQSFFSTQIALVKNEEFVVGVSQAPALKELFYAEKGSPAYLNQEVTKVSEVDSLAQAYVNHGSVKYFAQTNLVNNLLSLSADVSSCKGQGDFWRYTQLAEGKIDVAIEARTGIWDVAALKVIVEQAGGRVTDLKGRSLTKDSTSILATNGLLHEAALKYFN